MACLWRAFERRNGVSTVDDEAGGFRVDGFITRRIVKLFPEGDEVWKYGEVKGSPEAVSDDEFRWKGDHEHRL